MNTPIFALIFLFGSSILSAITASFQKMGRIQSKEEFVKNSYLFFFQHFLAPLFAKRKWEGLLFTLQVTKSLLLILYAIFATLFLPALFPDHFSALSVFFLTALIAIVSPLCLDLLLSLIAVQKPHAFFRATSAIASFFLLIFSPLTALMMRLLSTLFATQTGKVLPSSVRMRDKILEILQESEIASYLEPAEQTLILSVASFKERIAREVMVPRIDVFGLPSTTTIKEAAESFVQEGYSRIPIYRESVDHIIGVLLYKDVLKSLIASPSNLGSPIESLVKPVVYTPETKKISSLLQELKNKHIHLAIIVDEYGGTEGIVTIEDILEELVGEISDEYDIQEERLYRDSPSGGWIIDSKMNIFDIEEELGIRIPPSPEYDTIGGYIFHRAGAIPTKGWRIHHDDFDLEVLSSDERSIEKVRITPHQKSL